MNIAELFVNLGIKGADKTVGALGSVKKGLGEVGSMSLEAKAAIVGAMYGLERMFALSSQAGTGFMNFSALTGKSAQDLQKWQFAARQAGVGAESLTGSVKGVFNSMSNMLMGKGIPEGMGLLQQAVGGMDPEKFTDTFYMMQKLSEGMQKMKPEMGNIVGKSFGLSDDVISAMRRGVFTPDMLSKAPTYSDKEISSLDKANVAWANLGQQIEMAFGHFNAKHGVELVHEISAIVTEVQRLAEALVKLSEKWKVFDAAAEVFDGITKALRLLNGESVDSIMKDDKKKRHFGDGTWWMNAINSGEDAYLNLKDRLNGVPPLSPQVPQSSTSHNTTNINQSIIHHGDAKDTQAVKDLHRQGINHAYRQRSAQRQGS